MTSRRLNWFFSGGLGLILSQTALAIGLGDIAVGSYVNEPLSARIAVLDPKDVSESEVIASLASLTDFERLGVERHYSLSSLVFDADIGRSESASVRVTTKDPIREPYLNFLVELKWPEGRVLREYTVFLDLRPSQVTQSGGARARQPRADDSLVPGTYRVAPNDTLGAIAARFRVGDLSIDQMMLAIKEANAGKFLRDNINGIRAGVVLDIPTRVSPSLTAGEAAQKVVDQWVEWKNPVAQRGLRIVADNELEFTDENMPVPSGPENKVAANSPRSALPSDATSRAPAQNPVSNDDVADLAAIEARLEALSEQLIEIRSVVADKDQQIASLKAELATRPIVAPEQAITEVDKPAEATGVQSDNNVVWWGLLALALGALGYRLRHRLSASSEAVSGPYGASDAKKADTALDELLPVPAQSSKVNPRSDSEASKGYGESLLTGYAANQSLSDAIAEADIYVAYGRHQHALDTLEAASGAEPTNASGLLKMLEIYISLDRIDEAQGLLQAIEQSGDRDALLTATDQLSNISEVLTGDSSSQALAAEASLPEGAVDAEPPLDVDISLDIEFQEAAQPDSVTPKESDASSMLDTEDDPAETALDLARAYLDMGDKTGAKELLETAISMGDDAQVEIAKQLLASIE
jgi:pilus assembly protein FimV